ncbi:MAG: serine acetyltransferase [Eubacteriaceae bacterium]|nr:serine acetyltransferase [Eubacteriaceae bacterium]
MNSFKELYESDVARYGSNGPDGWTRKFLYYHRKISMCENKALLCYYRLRYRIICEKRGIEIPRTVQFGKGLYIGHPYNITINAQAKLGQNINIHKGLTIGQENRGARRGVPTIGNQVWIGINAVIVGNITIGDDVLIAPNSYVNFDVPSHSIVIGNPAKVIQRENATENYINNTVI